MDRSKYTIEDFVLDPDFKEWVLAPTKELKLYWDSFLANHPNKAQDISIARTLLLNISRDLPTVEDEFLEAIWENIESGLIDENTAPEGKVVPLDALSSIKKYQIHYPKENKYPFVLRWAGIIFLCFAMAITINLALPSPPNPLPLEPIVYEEHYAPPGVKSNLTLQDGSKVILNSGSTLKYAKNFSADKRELELYGEAFFEVARDSLRPFSVKTGAVVTRALGTSFNIEAYENEDLNISLVTGKVEVDLDLESSSPRKLHLDAGEGLKIDLREEEVKRIKFDEHIKLAWTRKTIFFDYTPMDEVTRILENWYGVKVIFINQPSKDLLVSAWFRDQTLLNVLEGLSYSARFKFIIDKDQVFLTFH